MEPERWQEVERVYHAALQCEESERTSFVMGACAADQTLRAEVESLLQYAERPAKFFETPALEVMAQALAENLRAEESDQSSTMIDARIAQYRIVGRLGTGGMGDVYRAVRADDQYEKQVAIKLVRQGLDTQSVYARFRQERQILAGFEHENIARLIDGGTTGEGHPYFVMELVEGQPIDAYCDERKLGIGARLDLFRTVCSAVQYAHQRLVVHRDIKPSNIQVTADGVPKLLDFGIATILSPHPDSPEAAPTVTAQRAMTPQFASPEQFRGELITTAADVYSLGVVLYTLLTGRLPYRVESDSPYDLAHAVCEGEPEKPSIAVGRTGQSRAGQSTGQKSATLPTPEWVSGCRSTSPDKLRRAISGDLDQILLKALRKEPQRRYSSAQDFAEDLRAYALGLPVSARRGTFSYRSGKFIKRNKVLLAVTAVVAMVMVAGAVAIVREARVARMQQARAERRFNDVRKLANSLMFEVHDSIKDLPGSTPARKLLVSRALEYLDSLSHEAGTDVSLRRELASAYERVGDVQGNFYRSNLGDTAGALSSYQNAVAIREVLARGAPHDLEVQSELADSYAKIASVARTMGEISKSVEKYRQSLSIREMLVQANPLSPNARYSLASCHDYLGDTLNTQNTPDWKGALEEYEKGLAGFESLIAINPKEVRFRRMVAITKTKIGYVFENTDKTVEALKEYREALSILEVLVSEDRSNALLQHNLSVTHLSIGDIRAKLGEFGPARKEFLEAISIDESLSRADPADMRLARNLAMVHAHLGDSEMKAGQVEAALREYRKALTIAETRSASDPANGEAHADVAEYHRRLEQLYEKKARRVDIPVAER